MNARREPTIRDDVHATRGSDRAMTTELVLTGTGYPRPHPDRAGPGVLVRGHGATLQLAHVIPAPRDADDERALIDEVRSGGYRGEVRVGHDALSVRLAGRAPPRAPSRVRGDRAHRRAASSAQR